MEWFAPDGDGQWGATPALLNTVTYRRHNLVAEPPPAGRYDLILCRNVLFYLVPRLREQVLERLAGALKPGGPIGDWPTLAANRLFEDRDLAPTLDVRSVFKG
ncbi:hypothetical protein LTR94_036646, partial [Friedmanniomyces endolithicus]